jgi:Flp pilus assembly protein TadG
MRNHCYSLILSRSGSTAAEFAMLLPLLLLLIFGLIDAGRYMWTENKAEKAAQMGVRWAVATNVIPTKLGTYSFVIDGGMSQGDVIPSNKFTGVTCYYLNAVKCDSSDAWVDAGNTDNINSAAFDGIYDRMKSFIPDLSKENVEVRYSSAGLGYAGNPGAPDIAPLVTVTIKDLSFTPITSLLFASFTMRNISAALTLEDGSGSFSN